MKKKSKLQPNIFIICGMLRSGSTLTYQLVCSILEKAGEPLHRIGFINEQEELSPKLREEHKNIVKVHHYNGQLGNLVKSGRAVAIFTYRDPRESIVSAMRQFKLSFISAVRWFETAVKNGNMWESVPNLVCYRYEEVIENIPSLVRSLSKELKIELTEETINSIAIEHSRENQKKKSNNIPEKNCDPVGLLHHDHVGDANRSDVIKSLNNEEILIIENRYEDWMRRHFYSKNL